MAQEPAPPPLRATAVVLAKDGVLLDEVVLWYARARSILSRLRRAFRLEPSTREKIAEAFGISPESGEIVEARWMTAPDRTLEELLVRAMGDAGLPPDETLSAVRSAVSDSPVDALDDSTVARVGAEPFLASLRRSRIPAYVLCRGLVATAERELSLAGLRPLVAGVFAADRLAAPPPSPSALAELLSATGVAARDAIYVGRDAAGAMMARETGVRAAVGVRCEGTPGADLAGYDRVVARLTEIGMLRSAR